MGKGQQPKLGPPRPMRRWPPPSSRGTPWWSCEFRQLAGSAGDVLILLHRLYSAKVEFASLRENFHTATGQGRETLRVLSALAEMEEERMPRRQKNVEKAKAAGRYKGRTPLAIDEEKFRAVCTRWRAGEMTAVAAMRLLGLKPNTFYRRVKDLGL